MEQTLAISVFKSPFNKSISYPVKKYKLNKLFSYSHSVSQNPVTVFYLKIKSPGLIAPTPLIASPPYTKTVDPLGMQLNIFPVNSLATAS